MWLAVLFGSLAASAAFGFYVPTCPENGSPVCATNGRAYLYFENKFKLDAYIYKQRLYDKPLPIRTDIENCLSNCYEIVCPAIFQPVCAQQVPVGPARTVPNPCHVDRLICQTKQYWKVIREGPCLPAYAVLAQDDQAADLIPTYAPNFVADQDQIPTPSLNTASRPCYKAPDPIPIAQNTTGQSPVLTMTQL
ncbi:uncharacterized protein LOC129244585 [Anastrepha obliqua]|uniref:uncharacterized protein LOC129244585 n=1 Tax=Anastrepha obliqua TaxID=95512 RepID=UPI00240A8DDE|nr:uncharacterized protein LOC129244585 [Anastrepha obliqua]